MSKIALLNFQKLDFCITRCVDYNEAMRKIDFENINHKNIFFVLDKPKEDSKKIVIMSHGFRSSSLGPARTFVDFSKILTDSGYSVLRFDQPNCGNSEGDFINSSFNEWVQVTTFFANKYLSLGYQVILLGQSMGATAIMAATAQKAIEGKIPCIILWVPGPVSDFNKPTDAIYEEEGQKYKGIFWQEAKDTDFFACLDKFKGGIHLVYGEKDRYVPKDQRDLAIEKVKAKNQPFMILKGQDHSPWEYDLAQNVYEQELKFIKKYLV